MTLKAFDILGKPREILSSLLSNGKYALNTISELASAYIDSASGVPIFIDYEHARIHAGHAYELSGKLAGLADNASAYFYLDPNAGIHWRDFVIKSDKAGIELRLFKNTTVTATGSTETSHNRNDFSSNESDLDIYAGATIDTDGTELLYKEIMEVGGSSKGGAESGVPGEWIFNPANTYSLKITNKSGQAADIVYEFFWYELGA